MHIYIDCNQTCLSSPLDNVEPGSGALQGMACTGEGMYKVYKVSRSQVSMKVSNKIYALRRKR